MEYIGEIVFFIVALIFICFFKEVKSPIENFIAGGMPIFGSTEKNANCSLNPPSIKNEGVNEERDTDKIIENMVDSATKCFSCEAQLGEAGQQKKCFSCGSTLLDNSDDAFIPNCPTCNKTDNANIKNSGNYFLLD